MENRNKEVEYIKVMKVLRLLLKLKMIKIKWITKFNNIKFISIICIAIIIEMPNSDEL
jgi:hypothetical protein